MKGRAVVAAVLASVLAAGCTVDVGGDDEPVGTVVRDGRVEIDLRHKPTRAEWRFTKGTNHQAYQAGFEPFGDKDTVETEVRLPGGLLRVPTFLTQASSGDAVTDAVADPLPPREIILFRRFADADQARRSLLEDAQVLGLHEDDRRRLRAGSETPVMDGFVRGWLSAYVDTRVFEDGYQVLYHFQVDYYHNEVVDEVVRDGVYHLDLTRRPSRADLGFLPYLDTADINRPPRESLAVRLTLANGVVVRSVEGVTSTSDRTWVDLGSGTVEEIRRRVRADAPALGVDRARIDRLYEKGASATLKGDSTDVYRVQVEVGFDRDQPGRFSASATYVFTYL